MEQILSRLQKLITLPSFSTNEGRTAEYIFDELHRTGISATAIGNNVLARNKNWNEQKPILLLNSHHDTVKPAASYSREPFKPSIEAGRLYGLGSNDAGGALCCLIQVFMDYYEAVNLPFNLLLIASAEEEISGSGGIQMALKKFSTPWGAIVGEPTRMKAAVAERGLMVIDGYGSGIAGHAARQEGKNALYMVCDDINTIRKVKFEKKSKYLPDTQAVVTQIEGGTQHNVVPDKCHFVIDTRINERYTNEEVFQILDDATQSNLKARSYRLNSSFLPEHHPLFEAVRSLGLETYGSPTLSDQALMNFPSLKMGPGASSRSHTADEFIKISELEEGYKGYHRLIKSLKIQLT